MVLYTSQMPRKSCYYMHQNKLQQSPKRVSGPLYKSDAQGKKTVTI